MTTINTSQQSAASAAAAAAAVSASSGSAAAGTTASSGVSEDRFLKLLVAQLKNQDPLNPMDNAQITSQMAQISTVSGIDKLNTTMQSLSGSMSSTQPLQAAGLVGHQVMVAGSTLSLAGGVAAGGFSLSQAVDQLTVSITDASGQLIHKADLGPQSAGLQTFAWDGVADNGQSAANGNYNFSITALAAGKKVDVQGMAVGRVDSVRPGADGLTLSLGGVGDAKLADVKQIF
jgi:flagellar basal-body rod modification protein FlgD